MRRKHIAGLAALALAAAVAVLVLSSVGGAAINKHARSAKCPAPQNFSPSGGKPGSWVQLNVGKAQSDYYVYWVYFRAKSGGSFYWLEASDVVRSSNSVMVQVPLDAYADGMVQDGPMAIWSYCTGSYIATSKPFHLK